MRNKLEKMNRLSLLKVIRAQNERIEELQRILEEKNAELDAAQTTIASVSRVAGIVDGIAKKLGINPGAILESSPMEDKEEQQEGKKKDNE